MPYLDGPRGASIYFEEFGSGPAVLFVNAGLATHAEWEHQVAALAADHRTVTFDWIGTGLSSKPNAAYTTQLLVDTIVAVISGLDLQDVTVVAQGIGAHGAILLAEQHPELVGRLVLVSGAPWYGGDRDGQLGGFSEEFSAWWLEKVSSASTSSVEAYDALGRTYLFRKPNDAVVGWFVAGAVAWPLFVFNAYCADMAEIDHRRRLPRIDAPAIVAQGRHDKKQRYEGAAVLAELLPNGRLVTFEESSHMVNIDEMSLFNETIRAFVRESHGSSDIPERSGVFTEA
ncbi:alpha/beta fold hydrolase [Microbacterium sp. RD1]|uniref:alpha/beta fold hydrolase n=1 Tax=Microbacterium sp. RD1 TaxID=3457313 RepID=UPI003FA6142C